VYVSWARNNRSALVRIPVTKAGKQSSTRIEYRSPDPACNPYLAFSVMLAAGLPASRGLRAAARGRHQRVRADPESGTQGGGLRALPQSLAEALDEMERSELVAEALGEHIFEWFLRNKRPSGPTTRPTCPSSS
jgi:glutamine synthetase